LQCRPNTGTPALDQFLPRQNIASRPVLSLDSLTERAQSRQLAATGLSKGKAATPRGKSRARQGKAALRSGRSRRRSRVVGLGREMRRLAPEMALAGCACWRRGCLGAALPCQCRSPATATAGKHTTRTYLQPQQLGSLGARGAGEKRGGGEEWRSVRDAVARTKMKSLVRLRAPKVHLLDRHV
jgi:hypothetical protein